MKQFKSQRIIIGLFGALIVGMGILTVTTNSKTISENVLGTMKTSWNTEKNVSTVFSQGAQALEEQIESNVYAQEMYINLYGLTERLLGRKYIRDANASNTVVKDNHGKLHFITFATNVESKVALVTEVKEALEQNDIPTLFVQAPGKVIEDFTELPAAVGDSSNSNIDTFLAGLDENGVDYIDLRQNVNEDNLDKATLFYDTDHHWTNPTAFWAVQKVVDYLSEEGIMTLDEQSFYTDLANYNITTYEKCFLGSQGRRVGKYYAGVDDYTLITPNFETQYNVTTHKSNSSTNYIGTFEEAIIKDDLIDMSASIYTDRYGTYFEANYPEVIIQNELIQNDKKIVIIKDSFALPFTAFLSTMVEQINMLDLRYFDENNLLSYLEDEEPDLVLFVCKSVATQ